VRMTHALVQVAAALMSDASGQHWGYELSKSSGVRSGVMYPVLQRMLDEGWLADGWEDQANAGKSKRPPRRYYELTDEGRGALGAMLTEARRDARFRPIIAPQIAGSWT
jgi:PadR family transcriptional regulator PadR